MKPPLNLLYLASWLNQRGLRAAILDTNLTQMSLSEVVTTTISMNPRFLGVPFYQATQETALTLCREVREQSPGTWIVAGGALATTSPESLLCQPQIDMCVIGEGEITLEELLRSGLPIPRSAAPDYSCLATIPGLAFQDRGQSVFTGLRAPLGDLDALPFLDFGLIDIRGYFSYHASIEMSSWLFYTTSRGCRSRCTFCATPVLWPGGLRRQSVPRLLAEIVHQRRLYPAAQFGFMDDSFFSDRAWLGDFFTGIAPLNVKYCCIGRADHLLAEDVRGLARTGCIYVALGIETGNQLRQKALKKHLDLNRVRSSVRLLAEHQVFCKGFFMLGFPDETPEEMAETINFAVELKHLGMAECNFFPVSIYPGTELAAGVSKLLQVSTIYQGISNPLSQSKPVEAEEDVAEIKLMRYANIPSADINRFFSAAHILDLVKMAYRKVAAGEPVTLSEFPAPLRK
jgi:radical SAM superfamily enzyme YgiQ (UPF0313 family)